VNQVIGLLGWVSRAEHLVVAVHDPATIDDEAEAVVRLVRGRQSVRRPEYDPDAELPRQVEYPPRALFEQGPIEALVGREIDPRVSREARLREVRDIRAAVLGGSDLARYVLEILTHIRADRELASSDC
jgi:hypothetical protein